MPPDPKTTARQRWSLRRYFAVPGRFPRYLGAAIPLLERSWPALRDAAARWEPGDVVLITPIVVIGARLDLLSCPVYAPPHLLPADDPRRHRCTVCVVERGEPCLDSEGVPGGPHAGRYPGGLRLG